VPGTSVAVDEGPADGNRRIAVFAVVPDANRGIARQVVGPDLDDRRERASGDHGVGVRGRVALNRERTDHHAELVVDDPVSIEIVSERASGIVVER